MILTVVAGTATLVGVVAFRYIDADLRTAVTVNGVAISRADLRERMALDGALIDARLAHLRTASATGSVTAEQQAAITAAIEANGEDPVSAAIDGLVDDTLIIAAANSAGLHPTVDEDAELARSAAADLGRELRWLTIVDPGRPGRLASGVPAPAAEGTAVAVRATQRKSAAGWAFTQLRQGTTMEGIKGALQDAGWTVAVAGSWIADFGPVSDLPEALLVAARDAKVQPGGRLGPFVDPIHGIGSVGIVQQIGDVVDPAASGIITAARVDGAAIHRWATARAAEQAFSATLLEGWQTSPQLQVRAAELVVGPANIEGRKGEFVSFAHLVVDQLSPDVMPAPGPDRPGRIASDLSALSLDARKRRFLDLVAAANRIPSDDPLRRSGELGYFKSDELIPELAKAAFAEDVGDGTLLGPIQTAAGPELYLFRGKFSGTLDERTDAELVEARTAVDLSSLAARISPIGDAPRTVSGPWRTEVELAGVDPARKALFETSIGALSDPFVLDDQIVLARPLQRRTAALDADALVRVAVRGWTAWLAKARTRAIVVVDPQPLQGLHAPRPSPTGSKRNLETPYLPDLPGTSGPASPALPTGP